MDAADRWREIEAAWLVRPGIGSKWMLHSLGLTGASGKVFGALVDERLVLKLPASRVAELIECGVGQPFTSGPRTMKEWVTIGTEHEGLWPDLVGEAHDFVNGVADAQKISPPSV